MEVNKEMTGSKKRRRAAVKREVARRHNQESTKRGERMREVNTAVRAALMIWEIVWMLVREHLLRGTGPGRPL